MTHEPVFTAADAFDLELLPRLNVIRLPDFGRNNNLAFRRNGGSH